MNVVPSKLSCEASEMLNEGVCEYLADMIMEAQQLALRIGAADVSTQLQIAYLETQAVRRRLTETRTASTGQQ